MRRARKIRFQAYDLEGKLVEYEADELFSRAVQHETDHLDGKLIIDYFEPLVLRENQAKLRELELRAPSGAGQRRAPFGRRDRQAARRDAATGSRTSSPAPHPVDRPARPMAAIEF